MFYFNPLKKVALLLFVLSNLVYAQSIAFDALVNGETRSDYYYVQPELLCIPTDYHFTSSPDRYCPYVKLFVFDSGGNLLNSYEDMGDNTIPDVPVIPGQYTLRLELWEADILGRYFNTAKSTYIIIEKYTLRAGNSFHSGTIYIDGEEKTSGAFILKGLGEEMTVSAIDQPDNEGYNTIWNETGSNLSAWGKQLTDGSIIELPGANSRTYTYSVLYGDNSAMLIADMRKVLSVNFQNICNSTNIQGQMQVGSNTINLPTSITAIEGNQITLTAVDKEDNYMLYTFDHWEDGSTNRTRSVSPALNSTYTAYFKGTPIYTNSARNLAITNSAYQPIQLTWAEHPNPLVTGYNIWRKCIKGNTYGPMKIATVPRGTTSYEDYEYIYMPGQPADGVYYDVNAYCESENTSSAEDWMGAYYGTLVKQSDSSYTANANKETILENSLDNYPNPFNPLTKIKYSLKENSFVTLQVYDILGNKIAELVNEYKPAGHYSVSFDASDKPSGIYICTIKANNYTSTKKMLLVK